MTLPFPLSMIGRAAVDPSPIFNAVGALAANVGDFDVSFPATVNANDIALLVAVGKASSGINFLAAEGLGFTSLAEVVHSGEGFCTRLAWKRCAGSEGSTSFNPGAPNTALGMAVIIVFSGCITSGTPYEDYGTSQGSDAATATSGTTTTTAANRLGVRIYAAGNDGASSPPSGWTERLDDGSALGTDGQLAIDTKIISATGTEATSTRAMTSAAKYIVLDLALLPAA